MNQEDFEITFLSGEEAPRRQWEIPKNAVQVGEIAEGDLRLYIGQELLHQMDALAGFDLRRETGCFLVGDYLEQDGRLCAIVAGLIEARYADASSASLTFTHETWQYVSSQLEEHFAGMRILGWQHTHPGYGVFLSQHDLFIQENFFNLPYQIAYVIDPIQGHRGFFGWKQGRICPLSGYYVFGNLGEEIRLLPGAERAPGKPKKKRRWWLFLLLFLLAVFLAAATAGTILFARSQSEQSQKGGGSRPGMMELAEPAQPDGALFTQ